MNYQWAGQGFEPLELTETSQGWDRPITPAHALAFVALCGIGGFIVGVGIAAFVSAAVGKRVWDAL